MQEVAYRTPSRRRRPATASRAPVLVRGLHGHSGRANVSVHAVAMVLDFAPSHWSSGVRLVAIALADRVGDGWQCWPSVEDIARRTGLSTRMVRNHLTTLQDEGIIRSEVRRRPNGTRQSNMWIWLWKHDLPPVRTLKSTTPTSGSGLHVAASRTSGSGLQGLNHHLEPTMNHQSTGGHR